MTRKEILQLEDMVEVDRAVGIAGTNYDRRRKLDKLMVHNIQQSYAAGKSIAELADKYGVTECAIKYWVDPEYRTWKNTERTKYANNSICTNLDRVERGVYKRYLVEKRRAVVYR